MERPLMWIIAAILLIATYFWVIWPVTHDRYGYGYYSPYTTGVQHIRTTYGSAYYSPFFDDSDYNYRPYGTREYYGSAYGYNYPDSTYTNRVSNNYVSSTYVKDSYNSVTTITDSFNTDSRSYVVNSGNTYEKEDTDLIYVSPSRGDSYRTRYYRY